MGPGGRRRSRASQSEPTPTNATESNMGLTGSSQQKKGGRKVAENLMLRNFIRNGGDRPKIVIHPDKRRPLGKWSAQWVTELGIICRQNIPLTWHYWKDVTKERRETCHKKILEKFDVDITQPHVIEAMNSSLRGRFKDMRHTLHQHYMSIPDGEDKHAHCHKTVTQEEWESLCTHFEFDEFKKISSTNKKNRKQQKGTHRGGCKSFVSHRHDQKDPETGKEPDCLTFYRNMRYKEKKGWVAPEAEQNHVKMIDISSQPVEEGTEKLTDSEILEKVLGKRSGYMRGLGHGEVPPSSRPRVAYDEEEVNELRLRSEEQARRAEDQERELNELRTWKASQEEIIRSQQQMLEAQAKKQDETTQLLNAIREKFGL